MEQEIRRTVQIKLRQTPEQAEEIEKLFAAFKIGLNFSLKQIEDAYQKTVAKYRREEVVDGVCAGCGKERSLIYSLNGKLFCNPCVMREYSEYTVRGMSISTSQRPVYTDIKTVVDVENLTHVHLMFSQAYGTWKSFNTWRNKREFERKRLETDLARIKEDPDTQKLYSAANDIWERAWHLQKEDKKITRLRAMALASKEIYGLNPDLPQRDIARVVNKLRDQNNLKRPLHFPEYKDEDDPNKKCNPVRSIQLHKNFLKFKDGKLHISLFHKKNNGQLIDFYRNKYLDQFLADMEGDNAVYTNLIKRVDGKKVDYYLMYPLTVKKNIPTIYDLADVFTVCFSPDSILVYGRYNDGSELLNPKGRERLSTASEGLVSQHIPEQERMDVVGSALRKPLSQGQPVNLNCVNDSDIVIADAGGTIHMRQSPSLSLSNLKKEKSIIPVTEINSDGQSLVWFRLGNMLNAKNHFSEKRTELMEHNTRNSFRLVKKMGNVERRFTRTFNHQISHAIVEYIADRSENPLIVMWHMTSGITADYGKRLNRVKKMWPVVQQQEFITHKASIRCFPVKMIQYSKENNLTCSFCHKPFRKKDEFGKNTKETIKSITAVLRRVKNLKCENCEKELNMLINQARNLSALAVDPQKGV